MNDSILAAKSQPVCVGTADTDGAGTQRERLDDVFAAADARVEDHRRVPSGLDDGWQQVDRGCTAVGLAATVIGALDPVDPGVDRAAHVLGMADALEHQR